MPDYERIDALKRQLCEAIGYDPKTVTELRIPACGEIEVHTVQLDVADLPRSVEYVKQHRSGPWPTPR